MQGNFPKIPLFLSIIFLTLSCLAFLYFYRVINNNNREWQLKERQWQNEMIRREEIKTLNSSIKIIEGERARLETHFAKSSDIVPFLDTIEELAPKVGAKAEVISVNITEDSTGLLVEMKASGNFESLYKFLTLLENSPYELEFTSMDLQKEMEASASTRGSGWDMIFKIKLLSFVQ